MGYKGEPDLMNAITVWADRERGGVGAAFALLAKQPSIRSCCLWEEIGVVSINA